MPALETVIQSGEEREIGTVGGEWLEERGQREIAAGGGGKKFRLVETEHVTDGDEALRAGRADGGAGFARDPETGAEHAGRERFEQREGEGDAGGAEEVAAVHSRGWRGHFGGRGGGEDGAAGCRRQARIENQGKIFCAPATAGRTVPSAAMRGWGGVTRPRGRTPGPIPSRPRSACEASAKRPQRAYSRVRSIMRPIRSTVRRSTCRCCRGQ